MLQEVFPGDEIGPENMQKTSCDAQYCNCVCPLESSGDLGQCVWACGKSDCCDS